MTVETLSHLLSNQNSVIYGIFEPALLGGHKAISLLRIRKSGSNVASFCRTITLRRMRSHVILVLRPNFASCSIVLNLASDCRAQLQPAEIGDTCGRTVIGLRWLDPFSTAVVLDPDVGCPEMTCELAMGAVTCLSVTSQFSTRAAELQIVPQLQLHAVEIGMELEDARHIVIAPNKSCPSLK
jgi:hypothetical protein